MLLRQKKGFTLIELVMVLMLIAILAGVVTVYSKGTIRHTKEKATLESIDQLQKAAIEWSATQTPPTYTGISIDAIKASNFLPQGFTGVNPFGGALTVAASSSDASKVVVTATAVPSDAGPNLVNIFTQRTDSVSYDAGSQTLQVTL